MDGVMWRCYRWCGHADSLRRCVDFPPSHPRHWTRFPTTCIGQWTDRRRALAWLWTQITDVHSNIADQYPRRAALLRDEYDEAARQLRDIDTCACSWSIALPDSIRLCVGIVAVYEHPSTNEGNT